MTTQCAQELSPPAPRVRQAVIHQCLFLLPLVCVVIGLTLLANSLTNTHNGSLHAYFKVLRHTYPLISQVMHCVSRYTSLFLLTFYIATMVFQYRRRQHLNVRFLISSLVIYYTLLSITLYVFKIGFGVARPYAGDLTNNPFSLNTDYHSFPSGHTAECAAITSSLAHLSATYLKTFLLGCILASVALSRVYVGMHHPFDLLPGALLGSLAPLLASLVIHKSFWRRLPLANFFMGKSLAK